MSATLACYSHNDETILKIHEYFLKKIWVMNLKKVIRDTVKWTMFKSYETVRQKDLIVISYTKRADVMDALNINETALKRRIQCTNVIIKEMGIRLRYVTIDNMPLISLSFDIPALASYWEFEDVAVLPNQILERSPTLTKGLEVPYAYKDPVK